LWPVWAVSVGVKKHRQGARDQSVLSELFRRACRVRSDRLEKGVKNPSSVFRLTV